MNILFVCTGNICRSPSAEALLRHKLSKHGTTSYYIDSAGIAGYHIGAAPDSRAILSAREYGIDMSALQARKVNANDYCKFDLIFAMDRGHMTSLQQGAPTEHHKKVKLFNAETLGKSTDVKDPYYGVQADFDLMFNKLDNALDMFIKHNL